MSGDDMEQKIILGHKETDVQYLCTLKLASLAKSWNLAAGVDLGDRDHRRIREPSAAG